MMKYMLLATAVMGLLGLGILTPRGEEIVSQERPFVVRVPQDFPTIQQAVDAVTEGGTVLIDPGTYQENIKITKSIRLIGAGQNTVNIWASDGIVINIESEHTLQIYLAGFRIELPYPIPFSRGISVKGAAQVIANQISVSRTDTGFEFLGENITALLSRVRLTSNGRGIWSGENLIVEGSIIEGNGLAGITVLDGNLKVIRSLLARNSVAIEIGGGWDSGVVMELVENAIIGNNDGLYLALGPIPSRQEKLRAANQPEIGPAVVRMRDNEISSNSRYGIALLECLKGELHTGFLALYMASRLINQSYIAFIEESNRIKENGKTDLCPPDYPWPPGFRK